MDGVPMLRGSRRPLDPRRDLFVEYPASTPAPTMAVRSADGFMLRRVRERCDRALRPGRGPVPARERGGRPRSTPTVEDGWPSGSTSCATARAMTAARRRRATVALADRRARWPSPRRRRRPAGDLVRAGGRTRRPLRSAARRSRSASARGRAAGRDVAGAWTRARPLCAGRPPERHGRAPDDEQLLPAGAVLRLAPRTATRRGSAPGSILATGPAPPARAGRHPGDQRRAGARLRSDARPPRAPLRARLHAERAGSTTRDSLPCQPGCRVNLVVDAYHRDARAGDEADPRASTAPTATSRQDRGRLNVARLRGARRAARAPATQRAAQRRVPVDRGAKRSILSLRLPNLRRGASSSRSRPRRKLGHRPPALLDVRGFAADPRARPRRRRHDGLHRGGRLPGRRKSPRATASTAPSGRRRARREGRDAEDHATIRAAAASRCPLYVNYVLRNAPKQTRRPRPGDSMRLRQGGFIQAQRYPADARG